jgi:tRNA pseudouridine38-40 synthase
MVSANSTENRGRIALIVQYDGTSYNGWQIQNIGKTVQGEIERALKILTREEIRITAAGRTDSGVHALGQVVHFDINKSIKLDRLCIGLNGILPYDISIKNAYFTPRNFHARFDPVERKYRYLIYNKELRNPFIMNRAMWSNKYIDPDYIKAVSNFLVGTFDFASFCKKASAGEGTIRKINSIKVERIEDLIEIEISGNAFLHHMIRIIVGTITDMYFDGFQPEYIKTILEKKDRDAAGKTAPAYGLYLSEIKYDPELSSYESAF